MLPRARWAVADPRLDRVASGSRCCPLWLTWRSTRPFRLSTDCASPPCPCAEPSCPPAAPRAALETEPRLLLRDRPPGRAGRPRASGQRTELQEQGVTRRWGLAGWGVSGPESFLGFVTSRPRPLGPHAVCARPRCGGAAPGRAGPRFRFCAQKGSPSCTGPGAGSVVASVLAEAQAHCLLFEGRPQTERY